MSKGFHPLAGIWSWFSDLWDWIRDKPTASENRYSEGTETEQLSHFDKQSLKKQFASLESKLNDHLSQHSSTKETSKLSSHTKDDLNLEIYALLNDPIVQNELRNVLYKLIEREMPTIRQLLTQKQDVQRMGGKEEFHRTEHSLPRKIPFNQDDYYSHKGIKTTPSGQTANPKLLDMCLLYNDSLTDKERRFTFKEQYQPLTIGVVNSVERWRNDDLPPVFQTTGEGSYLAIEFEQGKYAIFPKFGLRVEESIYSAGALGEIFHCQPSFERQSTYSNITITNPAIFVKKDSDNWELQTQGVLNLGQGQAT